MRPPEGSDPPGPMPASTVRAAGASDLAAIGAIYASYIPDTAITFDTIDGGTPSLDAWREKWEQGIRARHPWLVAELAGQVIGYAKADTFRTRRAYANTVETAIYLDRDHRGEGHGGKLYGTLMEEVAAGDFHTAIAGITLPNPASVGLHESLGFKPVGVMREVGYKLGSWWDVGWWQWLAESTPNL